MVPIWADEEGSADAPMVALIHGAMDRSTGMLRLSRRLDDRFRVLRYDRRGYGRSVDADGVHPGPFDMGAQVDDLVGLLAGRRALLIGHSFGGDVAMATAVRHPELVAGLALYEMPLSWEPWWPKHTAGAAARASAADTGEAAERFMRRLIGDALWESLPERTRATRRREGAALVGELLDLEAHRPWTAAQIHCPVVVSHGSDASEHQARGMRQVHDEIPGSTLVVLDGCRHDAPMSNSELFANEVVGAIAAAVGDPWAAAFSSPERSGAAS
ncbi:MAG: alpha/beta hydrolase fold protein [Ilumatobacteraceae bacterium]|nr:alpha/beta hydrolase fold protein [Ilumatobacteraceae bacterium]